MKITDSIHQTRVVVAGAVVAAGIGVGLFVPTLLDAGADPVRRPTTPDTQPDTDPGPGAPLADGRYFGAIGAAYVGPPELVFDPMELLVGDAARAAARADGVPEDEILDFYIRNAEHQSLSLPVAGAVVVTRVDSTGSGIVEGVPGDYDAFTLSFDENTSDGAYGGADGRYSVTVEDGFVVRIDEQYLP
jgi:hypothetical protein